MYADIGSKIPCKYVCMLIKYFPQENKYVCKRMCILKKHTHRRVSFSKFILIFVFLSEGIVCRFCLILL